MVPYAQPYYDAYLSKHVAVIQPHISRVNEQVILPASAFLESSYNTYGRPRVVQAQNLSQERWEKLIKPRLEATISWTKDRYEITVAPYTTKIKAVTQPHYDNALHSLQEIFQVKLLPRYRVASPYVEQTYYHGRKFVVETALPFADWIGNRTIVYISRIIWPRLQIIYGENIEPQLSRIGQRLGRYRDSKKVEQIVENVSRYCILPHYQGFFVYNF